MNPHTYSSQLLLAFSGAILWKTRGYYSMVPVILLTIAFVLVAVLVLWRRPSGVAEPRISEASLSGIAVLFTGLLVLNPLLAAPTEVNAFLLLRLISLLPLLASLLFLVLAFSNFKRPIWFTNGIFVAATVALVSMQILTIFTSPRPPIDVWVIGNLASDYLWQGVNPYTASYPDIYEGRSGYEPGVFYWPAYLYWIAPFRKFFGDIRFASVAAEVGTAVVLFKTLVQLKMTPLHIKLLIIIFLSHPVILYVIEMAWSDPILVFGVAVLIFFLSQEKWMGIGIVLGLISGLKQYGLLLVGLTLLLIFSKHRPHVLRVGATAVMVSLVLLGPFIVLSPEAFIESTVQVYLDILPRKDALSLPALAMNQFGMSVPLGVSLITYCLLISLFSTWLIRSKSFALVDWAMAATLLYGLFFLTSKMAFCNYYFFVAFLNIVVIGFLLESENRSLPKLGDGRLIEQRSSSRA